MSISQRYLKKLAILIVSISSLFFGGYALAANSLKDGLSNPYPAPAIAGITDWINSPPLQINQLKGKVVLLDFWTYSCINCVRTLPYVRSWYNKYHDKGLVIIGIHTPEFGFEKDLTNVKTAVQKYGVEYPVALDSNSITWNNYNNHYWPAQYLIDKNGYVVYQHFGEGDDDITENNIRFLLGLNSTVSNEADTSKFSFTSPTPETYLGYARAERFASQPAMVPNQTAQYFFPEKLNQDDWGLQGNWTIMPDKITAAAAGAGLKIHFKAQKVFMVMGSATHQPIKVQLLLNGKPLLQQQGKDVKDSSIIVNTYSLYEVVVLNQSDEGILEITATQPGLTIYTFTFG